jgi:hypothetical protein
LAAGPSSRNGLRPKASENLPPILALCGTIVKFSVEHLPSGYDFYIAIENAWKMMENGDFMGFQW